MVCISDSEKEIQDIFSDMSGKDLNEASTRFFIIDEVLKSLGWNKTDHEIEKYENGDYTDYELGTPRCLILEAKRTGKYFDIDIGSKRLMKLKDLIKLDTDFEETYKQTSQYCLNRGVSNAIISNGHQFIGFIALRSDGAAPLEGEAVVFYSHDDIVDNFADFFKFFSATSIRTGRFNSLLKHSNEEALPNKLSSTIRKFGEKRYRSDSVQSLSVLSQILIEDIPKTEDAEKEFLKRCYCSPGALSQYSMITKKMLNSRYSGLTVENKSLTGDKKNNFSRDLQSEVWAEAHSKRPIVVLGDAGVGKTTFIRNLIHNSLTDKSGTVVVHIDLGINATFDVSLSEFILREVEDQLFNGYGIDIQEMNFVSEVWKKDIARYKRGVDRGLFEAGGERADETLRTFLRAKLENKTEHIKQSVSYLSKKKNKKIVLVLDNADQREAEFQDDVYLKSQEAATQWSALVFVSLRPTTFYRSQRVGAASGYSNRIFTVFPPKEEEVLRKRLQFAVDVVEGRVPFPNTSTVLQVETVSLVIKAILNSLPKKDLSEFLSNITGGNIRQLINLTSRFIGSANVEFDKIIELQKEQGNYVIPLHEFQKEALLGEYQYFDAKSSLAHNVFDLKQANKREHFLDLILLGYFVLGMEKRPTDGFVETNRLLEDIQKQGFELNVILWHLNNLSVSKLIENNIRIDTEKLDDGVLFSEISSLRITSVGAYHLKKWAYDFAFIDCMSIDTPILEESYRAKMAPFVESFSIKDRYERANLMKEYLGNCWRESDIQSPCFNWASYVGAGADTFAKVKRAISFH